MTRVVRVRSPGGVEQFEIAGIELPAPAADEVRVRQTAIGVNFVDIYQRSGLYPMPPANIPGVEGVGVIAAVGADVTSVRPGDRIAYAGAPVGAYAVERNLPAWRAVRLPDALSDEAVASSFVKGHYRAHAARSGLPGRIRHDTAGSQRRRRPRAVADALGDPSRRDRDRDRQFGSQGGDRPPARRSAHHCRPRCGFCASRR